MNSKIMIIDNEVFIEKEYASIYEIKDLKNEIVQRNEIRIYRNTPSTFNLQIRTHKPINEYQNGKPRKMIANVCLTFEEIESIYRFIKMEKKRCTIE